MNNALYSLRLAVFALVAGGLTLGGMALACGPYPKPKSTNVNSITNLGNGRSTTVIVEPGPDGQLTRSVFFQGNPPMLPVQEPVPAVPAVPATPEPLLVQPQPQPQSQPQLPPVEPMPEPQPMPQPQPRLQPQPQPVEPMPQPQPVQPCPVPAPEIVIRIPVPQPPVLRGPVVQIPGIRLPNLEIPAMEVPANRTIITDGPGGRTMIYNSGNGRNTSIISSGGRTMIFGDGLCYTARDGRFWSKSMHCQKLGCTIYYDPRTTLWFRYCERDATYRPAPVLLDDDE